MSATRFSYVEFCLVIASAFGWGDYWFRLRTCSRQNGRGRWACPTLSPTNTF